jgi:thiol-disulfide isomerase/thioredoxin
MYINVTSPTDAQKLSSMLDKGDWLVLYYADWCGHCKDMKPEWHKTVDHLKASNKNIHIGEIESNHIPNLLHKPEIAGFPTIKMYNHGKEVANFDNQPRIAQNITQFAMDNSSKRHHAPKLQAPVPKPHHLYKRHTTKRHAPKLQAPVPKPHHSSKRHTTKRHTTSHHKSHSLKHKTPKHQSKKQHLSKRHTTKRHTRKSHGTTMKRMMNKEKATKDVFGELIKSFSRIGKEARTDAQLLKQAKAKL